MAEVLEFPTRETQAFAFLERELRRLLQAKGADDALIEFALETLTAVYAELDPGHDVAFQVDLPGGITEAETKTLQSQITEGVAAVHRQNHRLMLTLAARLVLAEMRLFQQQRSR
ncbi:hypothetical protein NOR51B_1055 [Luminiphilus syltensis NOR5-1B]|uniref:Uncharacterized protein n=1 Tax=Luminiphilus syltensis NOR5-1B TaxID=565045 RepID=B8KS10_9GAMM|nr:hypothetical protein [Luminiphilus syltensis]EED35112.1 hypothetical protein NOR51B_1055 [Luminiphilus syltensis NOR5-1B]